MGLNSSQKKPKFLFPLFSFCIAKVYEYVYISYFSCINNLMTFCFSIEIKIQNFFYKTIESCLGSCNPDSNHIRTLQQLLL